jgi:hypothetical protein
MVVLVAAVATAATAATVVVVVVVVVDLQATCYELRTNLTYSKGLKKCFIKVLNFSA